MGGDTGMVGTHLPQGGITLHAAIADNGIHDGVIKAMAHMQAAGDVRWRDHHAVGRALTSWLEIALVFPGLVPLAFDSMGFVGFIHGDCWLSLAALGLASRGEKMNKKWVGDYSGLAF